MNAPIHPATDGAARGPGGVLPSAPMPPALRVIRPHEVVPDLATWVLTEEQVPESSPHEILSERLKHLLRVWAERTGRAVKIGRNLAVRWDRERPQIGLDPDVYVVEPPPPEGDEVFSLLLWKPGHHPPLLGIELVSPSHPTKDYRTAPLMYALCGVGELWVLDPRLEGPRSEGRPYRIQIWRRLDENTFALVQAGEGPAWSEALQGWVRFVPERRSFDLTSDEEGVDRWLTPEEVAQRRADAAQRRADADRAAREVAQRRIEELEALLARTR